MKTPVLNEAAFPSPLAIINSWPIEIERLKKENDRLRELLNAAHSDLHALTYNDTIPDSRQLLADIEVALGISP